MPPGRVDLVGGESGPAEFEHGRGDFGGGEGGGSGEELGLVVELLELLAGRPDDGPDGPHMIVEPGKDRHRQDLQDGRLGGQFLPECLELRPEGFKLLLGPAQAAQQSAVVGEQLDERAGGFYTTS